MADGQLNSGSFEKRDYNAMEKRVDGIESWVGKLESQLADLVEVLHGDKSLGVVAKVQIIWRTYVWVLCTISALAGSLITFLVMRAIM